jgi:predicted N-acyltransferase
MRHEYLLGLERSGSAVPDTGWTPRVLSLWRGSALEAACAVPQDPLLRRIRVRLGMGARLPAHGLAYYPKAVLAVPFTPVPGTRLLARGRRRARPCWAPCCACATSWACPRCTCCSAARTICRPAGPRG